MLGVVNVGGFTEGQSEVSRFPSERSVAQGRSVDRYGTIQLKF
jgi:hypothetical protein